MPQLSTAARNAANNAIVDLIDIGSTNPEGRILIGTTAMGTVLATLDCNNPAFGDSAAGVSTLDVSPAVEDTNAANSGTAAEFQIVDRDETVILTGDVSTSGAALNLNTTTITAGVKVSITSMTVTVPAGSI